MKSCAIVQSSYLPWRGYFDLIARADTFIFYDSVQFTRRDWRSRNRVKTAHGLKWLTVPVRVSGHFGVPIFDVEIDNSRHWGKKHLETIRHSYGRAPYFDEVYEILELHLESPPDYLFELNRSLTQSLWSYLSDKSEKEFIGDEELSIAKNMEPSEKLLALCEAVGAGRYLSGPSAKSYLDTVHFERAGVSVQYVDYRYQDYPQPHGAFEPFVSIVDGLVQLGRGSLNQLLRR